MKQNKAAYLLLGAGMAALLWGYLREKRVPAPDEWEKDESTTIPQPGDVLLFYHPRRGRDYFIRWFTRSPFYHAALWDGNGMVIEARPPGVRRNSLAGRDTGYLIVPAPLDGAAARTWAHNEIGAGYDRTDMLVIVLEHIFTRWHINYTPLGKYTCAEFAALAFQEGAGKDLFPDKDTANVTPADWARYLPQPLHKRAKQARPFTGY